MESSKEKIGTTTDKVPSENPNCTQLESSALVDSGSTVEMAARVCRRAPFTSLSQVDADLALARALQEQERAYLMLRINEGDGSDYASSYGGSYEEEEREHDGDPGEPYDDQGSAQRTDSGDDAFDANESRIDPEDFDNDEAYARALQDAEERDVAIRLMALAGLNDWSIAETENHDSHDQDSWSEADPDELSYEELVALGEIVGSESRGLSVDTIASLPSVHYKAHSRVECNDDQCIICRLEFEDGDSLIVLSCKHTYHTECINKWLQINKVCPVCSAEVSASPHASKEQIE